jgi:hypothetical protein
MVKFNCTVVADSELRHWMQGIHSPHIRRTGEGPSGGSSEVGMEVHHMERADGGHTDGSVSSDVGDCDAGCLPPRYNASPEVDGEHQGLLGAHPWYGLNVLIVPSLTVLILAVQKWRETVVRTSNRAEEDSY